MQAGGKRIDDLKAQQDIARLQLARMQSSTEQAFQQRDGALARAQAADEQHKCLVQVVQQAAAKFDSLFSRLQQGASALDRQIMRLQFASAPLFIIFETGN